MLARRPPSNLSTTARAPRRTAPRPNAGAQSEADLLAHYAQRGAECAFANLRMLGRIVGAAYDEALRPADLRASQLALLWAILACEPADMSRLKRVTHTDQTTLSRTVEKLRVAGLVDVSAGEDRRVRVVRLTARGRRSFLRAMPHWEIAQRNVSQWLSLADLRALSRSARRQAPPPSAELT